ncbi:hypothetical protein SSPIM334S_06099 [Streptomyces spiroverticillatus]|uniref:maltokinase N-terminal cap-like domain-containing protein n=1 Tax=Streptomyces finlayi TaxID=67296 RepID=UPI001672068A|nr:1,4-alpha-glucan branching protein [Streptomyces finlayi]
MATIHETTVIPTKLELLTRWLPTRPWYQGTSGTPELAKAGGFRLDDPEGEVGLEFMVVTDTSGASPVAYHVPVTYRGAPLEGAAEQALVGTTEHGVLGKRWVYDGAHDPVLVGQLLALLHQRAVPQAQSLTDTPDLSVTVHSALSGELVPADAAVVRDGKDATDIAVRDTATLTVTRVLRPAPEGFDRAHVTATWQTPDGTERRGVFAELAL